MRKTLLGTLLLGGALIFGSTGAFGQVAASTVFLSGTTGNSCVYTGISMQPNGGITVTCSGGAVTPPAAPTIVTAIPLNASISLAFTPPGGTVTGYTATCNPGNVTASGSGSPILVSGLTNDTLYTCSVAASNGSGTGASSATVTATPTAGATATVPDAPIIGAGTPGNATATIAFTAPASNGGAAITAYTASCTGGGDTKTQSGPASPLTVSALANGTAYTCSVAATNSVGTSAASGTVSVTPVAPTAPGAPTIGAVTAGNGSASVAFTAPGSNGGSPITSYTASCTPTGGGAAVTGTGAASPITVSGLTNGTAYACSVTATNAANLTGASSAAGSVTPVAGCSTPPGTTIAAWNGNGTIYTQTETGTIPAGNVKAYPFVVDPVAYPYGIMIEIEAGNSQGAYNAKDMSVSTCPGVFDGLATPCRKTNQVANRINTSTAGNATSLCQVTPGKTYYFNLRPSNVNQDAAAMMYYRSR